MCLDEARQVFDSPQYASWVDWAGVLMPRVRSSATVAEQRATRILALEEAIKDCGDEKRAAEAGFEKGSLSAQEFMRTLADIERRLTGLEGELDAVRAGRVDEAAELEVDALIRIDEPVGEETEPSLAGDSHSTGAAGPSSSQVTGKRKRDETVVARAKAGPVRLFLASMPFVLLIRTLLVRSVRRYEGLRLSGRVGQVRVVLRVCAGLLLRWRERLWRAEEVSQVGEG
jgi:hypothetical protein